LSTNLYKKASKPHIQFKLENAQNTISFKEIKGKGKMSACIWWKPFIGPIVLNLEMIDYSQSF